MSDRFHASGVKNPDIPSTYWGCYGGPSLGLQWVTDRGRRRVFTSPEEAEFSALRILVAHLNSPAAVADFTARRTDKDRIKGYRAPGVGKGHGRVDDKSTERDRVFARFKKD